MRPINIQQLNGLACRWNNSTRLDLLLHPCLPLDARGQ